MVIDQGKTSGIAAPDHCFPYAAYRIILEGNYCFYFYFSCLSPFLNDIFKINRIFIVSWNHMQMFQSAFPYFFCPKALPNSGRLHIPAVIILFQPALFSSRLRCRQAVVYPDHDSSFPIYQRFRNIEGKSCITTLMASDKNTVDPEFCFIVNAFQIKNNPSSAFP